MLFSHLLEYLFESMEVHLVHIIEDPCPYYDVTDGLQLVRAIGSIGSLEPRRSCLFPWSYAKNIGSRNSSDSFFTLITMCPAWWGSQEEYGALPDLMELSV